jgi:hypothetical protein
MPRDRSPQESFWAGEFGNDYVGRNDDKNIVAGNIRLFASALKGIPIKSVLEVGSNIGMNLAALRFLYPQIGLSAIEINETAANELSSGFLMRMLRSLRSWNQRSITNLI